MTEALARLLETGGWVMIFLIMLSAAGMILLVERALFWLSTHRPGRGATLARWSKMLRDGQFQALQQQLQSDHSVYSILVKHMLDEPGSQAAIIEAVESQRARLQRFMPTLSTIITAAPMLGILGTVVGIVSAFEVISADQPNLDAIAGAIGKALLTTGVGLVIALVILFPYNAYRAQIDRTLGRFETLVASSEQGHQQQQHQQQSPPNQT